MGAPALRLPPPRAGLAGWLAVHVDVELPPNPCPDAVQVMTCHAAKGLEWPVLVVADLAEPPGPRIFDQLCAESDGSPGQAEDDPPASRWLRYWPWPNGD